MTPKLAQILGVVALASAAVPAPARADDGGCSSATSQGLRRNLLNAMRAGYRTHDYLTRQMESVGPSYWRSISGFAGVVGFSELCDQEDGLMTLVGGARWRGDWKDLEIGLTYRYLKSVNANGAVLPNGEDLSLTHGFLAADLWVPGWTVLEVGGLFQWDGQEHASVQGFTLSAAAFGARAFTLLDDEGARALEFGTTQFPLGPLTLGASVQHADSVPETTLGVYVEDFRPFDGRLQFWTIEARQTVDLATGKPNASALSIGLDYSIPRRTVVPLARILGHATLDYHPEATSFWGGGLTSRVGLASSTFGVFVDVIWRHEDPTSLAGRLSPHARRMECIVHLRVADSRPE